MSRHTEAMESRKQDEPKSSAAPSSPNPALLFLRVWRVLVWVMLIGGVVFLLHSMYQEHVLGEGGTYESGRRLSPPDSLIHNLVFLALWIGVFSVMLFLSRSKSLSAPRPQRQDRPWSVEGAELKLGLIPWYTRLIVGGGLISGGAIGLYYQVIKPLLASSRWSTSGFLFLLLLFLGMIALGYAAAAATGVTRFNLSTGAYEHRSGLVPFSKFRRGSTQEDLLQVRLAPSSAVQRFPGDEQWELSFEWKPRSGLPRHQNVATESGHIQDGRNTAEVRLEKLGRELADLLQVPFTSGAAWWADAPAREPEVVLPAGKRVGLPADLANLPFTPLVDLGYSSPLSYSFRKRGASRARIGPTALAPALFIFFIVAIFSFFVLLGDWTSGVLETGFYSAIVGLSFACFIGFFFSLGSRTWVDLNKGKINLGTSGVEIDLSRVRALQICDAGHTKSDHDHPSVHIYQLVLVEEGMPPRRHGILAGNPGEDVEKIGRQLAGFIGVELLRDRPQ